MKMNVTRLVPLLALAAFVGCISTFQSARVLDEDELAVGGGMEAAQPLGASGGEASFVGNFYFWCRYGIGWGTDAGILLSPSGMLADIRYQVLRRPLLVAVGLGAGMGLVDFSFTDGEALFVGQALALVGNEHRVGEYTLEYHVGVKPVYRFRPEGGAPGNYWVPVALVGGSFGDWLRVLPEVSLAWGRVWDTVDSPPQPWQPQAVSLGLGVEYRAARLAQ